jgi:hypothetical protein
MKKVVLAPEVHSALRTLGPDEVRRVEAWFDHLSHWDSDAFVRENSPALPGMPEVRMLRTTTDLRIFFSIEGETITILDVTTKQAILMVAAP